MCLCLAVSTDNQASYFAKKERTSKLPFLTTAILHASLSYVDITLILTGDFTVSYTEVYLFRVFFCLFWVSFRLKFHTNTVLGSVFWPSRYSWFPQCIFYMYSRKKGLIRLSDYPIIRLCIWWLGCNASPVEKLISGLVWLHNAFWFY